MVFCTLINISLDISANISWWLLKNTLYGTYYLITYIKPKTHILTKEEIELIELRREITQLNRQLHIINNPHIISRNQLMLNNTLIEEHNNDTPLIEDEFIFINNDVQLKL